MKKIIFTILLVLAFSTKSFAFDNPNIILDKNIYNLKLLNYLQNNTYTRSYYAIPNINLGENIKNLDTEIIVSQNLEIGEAKKYFAGNTFFEDYLIGKIGEKKYKNLIKNGYINHISSKEGFSPFGININYNFDLEKDETLELIFSPFNENSIDSREFNSGSKINIYSNDFEFQNLRAYIYDKNNKNLLNQEIKPEVSYKILNSKLGESSFYRIVPIYKLKVPLTKGNNYFSINYMINSSFFDNTISIH